MKKSFLMVFVAGGLFMASCTEDAYNPDRIKEDYEQNFVDLFGEINPNQDWNVAELKSVTVEPGNSTEVEIYAKGTYAYQLVGNYKSVSGKQTLKFDAPENLNDFIVLADGKAKFVKNGDEVSFTDDAVTRTYYEDVEGVWSETSSYKEFEWNEVKSFIKTLEEGEDNTGSGVPVNFDYVAGKEPITIYPIYWNAHYYHRIGIYIKGEDGKIKAEHLIYQDKMGDELQYNRNTNWWGNNKCYWQDASGNESVSFSGYKGGRIRSKGFTIDLPEGTVYGFYIEVSKNRPRWDSYNDGKYYTNASLNNPAQNMASSFKQNGDEYTYLGFDDDSKGDHDLNDLMFIADPEPEIIDYEPVPDPDDPEPDPEPNPEPEPESPSTWTIAVEDLGNTDDYDFNDIVFTIKHVAGTEVATITPLAAGGSLETYLCYTDGEGEYHEKEFHSFFGVDGPGSDGTYPLINTQSVNYSASSFEIKVDKDFSVAEKMGGFTIKVVNNQTQSTVVIAAPDAGAAPQMICVPSGWQWPVERVNINDAYPGFSTWINDPTQVDWYKNPVNGQVMGVN